MMRGMAFTLIAEIIIGVASLLVLLYLFTPFPQALQGGYCYMYNGFVAIIPFSEDSRPTPPSFCRVDELKNFERVNIRETNVQSISTRIASYALACWKISGDGTEDEDIVCFEIYLDDVSGQVTQNDVMNAIPAQYQNNFIWNAGSVGSRSILAVHYDYEQGKVIIE